MAGEETPESTSADEMPLTAQPPTPPIDETASSVTAESTLPPSRDSGPSGASRFTTTYVPPPPTPQFKNRRRLTPEEAEAQQKRRAIRRRRRRTAGLVLIGFGAAILLAGAWVTWRTYQAYSHLQAASDEVSQLQSEIKDISSIDLAAADRTVSTLQLESGRAHAAVSDPLYRAAGHLPWVGANLVALSEVTTTVDSLSVDVVPSLVQIAKTLSPPSLAPKNGTVDLAPIEAASPLLQKADAAVNASKARLAAIDRTAVVRPVGDAVVKLWTKLDQASSITATGARVARLLPPMLGARGERTYLIVFQNLAEVRATGGIFGSFAVVQVSGGRITITDRGRASSSIGIFKPPVTSLDAKMTNLYSNRPAIYPQDVNFTPDYPTAAALFAKMYTARKGTAIDGVIATDPVALGYALKGSAPIDVGSGITLTSANIASVLLSGVYAKFPKYSDQHARDVFLANSTNLAFKQVMAGTGDASAIMSGLKQAAGERRILLWSADKAEQQDIGRTGLAGALSESVGRPTIGVFFNDGTAAKLDYYLSSSLKITAGECQLDGRRQLQVAVTMRYSAQARALPTYVVGDLKAAPPYVLQTNLLVFAPLGGGISAGSQDGRLVALNRGEDLSREAAQLTVRLKPGGSTTVVVTVLAPVSTDPLGHLISPTPVLTPGVHPWVVSVAPYKACGIPQ